MDSYIASLPAQEDGDLMLCVDHGVAYQRDRSNIVKYDGAYWDKCSGYEGQEIAQKINAGRVALVKRWYGDGPMVDIGIGSGEFIKTRPHTWGIDVNPVAVSWLMRNGYYANYLSEFEAFSLWDVIEHVETPDCYFAKMPAESFIFISLPIFNDLRRIRESKHYRPGEHLTYWSEAGFVNWMGQRGFRLLERQDYETAAGRDSILSFAFHKL